MFKLIFLNKDKTSLDCFFIEIHKYRFPHLDWIKFMSLFTILSSWIKVREAANVSYFPISHFILFKNVKNWGTKSQHCQKCMIHEWNMSYRGQGSEIKWSTVTPKTPQFRCMSFLGDCLIKDLFPLKLILFFLW